MQQSSEESAMQQSLEWRLGRTFIKGFSLVLFVFLIQNLLTVTPVLFTARLTTNPPELWTTLAVTLLDSMVRLALVVLLWRYSDKIASRLADSSSTTVKHEQFDIPFELGVGLVGLFFFIDGLKRLAGEAAAWSFGQFDMFQNSGTVPVQDLAAFGAEAVLGLVFFVGAKTVVEGILRWRNPPAGVQDDAV